jgi:hypothetical protein
MESWDPDGVAHLETIRDKLSEVGLIDFLRGQVIAVWTANRDRHEPEELFDDSWTLASQSSRNLANRVHALVQGDDQWQSAGVSASKEHNASVLHVPGVEIRMVKVPTRAGRRHIVPAWWDEPNLTSISTDKTTPQHDGVPSFGTGMAPTPTLTLKPQTGKGTQS